MQRIKTFVYAVLAGLSISIGGAVFLASDSKVVGAVFFTVGLFAVCTFGFNLFTGKVCYVFERDASYAIDLPIIWLGNLCGAVGTAGLLRLTRIGPALTEKAAALAQTKLNDSPWSVFILAIFCNILIFIAVDGFNKNPHELGKYLSLLFGVTVFILCGFEHCVANMFYFAMGEAVSLQTLGTLLIMTAGNAVGGVLIPLLRRVSPRDTSRG